MTKKTVHIRAALDSVSSQRVPYKPYGYQLLFQSEPTFQMEDDGRVTPLPTHPTVYVEFDIDDTNVIEHGAGFVVLSLDGLNAILQVTADSVDALDKAYMKKVQGG